ncbi:hypothetical protein JOF53_007913 [Crossiella equi]|uniref:Ricin B lectin domain-containing protein n=1 Tax=Crossiella equi TaxID=130796 RepID=A0ABS5AR62_9PSEU|nr:ricin-type beta-trefoil lectin domain protein [Crossiella equi]MBP2479041.1 hypothetical protein [Crossiella equi]
MRARLPALALATAGLLTTLGLSPAHAAEEAELWEHSSWSDEGGKGCLAPLWGGADPGTYVGYEKCDKSKGQTWQRIWHDTTFTWLSLRHATSGLCATVLGGGTAEGADVVLQPCANTPEQRIRRVQRDVINIVLEYRFQHTDMCLTAGYVHHRPGSDVVQRGCQNVRWQKWSIEQWTPPA